MLTSERLCELLAYNAVSGMFRWRVGRGGKARKGFVAGAVNVKGYRYIRIDGVLYKAARLAWLYNYGCWPKHEIDHKNRKRDDNRLKNLREARRGQNVANSSRKNSSGFKGVYHDHTNKRAPWMALISANKNRRYLGHYVTPQEAHKAYIKAARRYHGKFAHGG